MDWKRELVIAHFVQCEVAALDVDGLFANTLPEVAASEDEVCELERRLGFDLSRTHKQFLLHANGWRGFKGCLDVFSVNDYYGGPRAQRAMELIDSIEDLKGVCGYSKADLIPVAVDSFHVDVMLLVRPHANGAGGVLWLADGMIESFANFGEWFLAMVDYNRLNYEWLLERNRSRQN